ncbi:DExH-box ATP-dependent RNA helicase DExH14-like isoform X2 [Prunus yedoensis var. nudiflora]|uniref:DExH-box ATP-dependent RNA helicase DExH14-like isoform X2 n=1 Tax=Prunus yedoensis var. nudiflora TaxID=2094558 RepID=A0A314Z1L6_PRUYE|nr:DExH-box ATP-dependent RNA helicase DExH14-like isoform X2 [Prunus yedoensis var. nudiflora]
MHRPQTIVLLASEMHRPNQTRSYENLILISNRGKGLDRMYVTCISLWIIEITKFDEFAQAAFHGYKSLNRIQSRMFHTVCAPIGAGKTNIAMISILHEALAAEVT